MVTLPACGLFSWPDRYAFFGYRDPIGFEWDYLYLGGQTGLEIFCEKISPKAIAIAGFNPSGTKVSLLKSSCYDGIASNHNRRDVCDKVVSVSTFLWDGSKRNKRSCLTSGPWGGTPSRDSLKQIMQLLGYNENNWSSAVGANSGSINLNQPNIDDKIFAIYLALSEPSEDFKKRLSRLPNYP